MGVLDFKLTDLNSINIKQERKDLLKYTTDFSSEDFFYSKNFLEAVEWFLGRELYAL